MIRSIFQSLTGGRPMQHLDFLFTDVVSGKPVHHWRDTFGREWMANGRWSGFRVEKPSATHTSGYSHEKGE